MPAPPMIDTTTPARSSDPELPSLPGAEARRLALALRMTPSVVAWLVRQGHSDTEATRRFLEPRLGHLTKPDQMADRAVAANRLARAITSGEPIVVFGDYDCDGMTSTAIATEVLSALGGNVTPLLASRFDGGYGVSKQAAERIRAANPSVLVTCDCGSSDHATLGPLAEAGIDVIVVDHHLVPEEPLPAVAFLNPHRPDCGFAYKGLASCGLVLSIAAELRATLGRKLDIRRWLDLVAIGTIADVAPLDGDNRALVRAGLSLMRTAPRPGVRALLELGKVDGMGPITAEDVAFRIAPRLNAPGRLGAPDPALHLLLARTDEEARALAAQVEQLSDRRKGLQAEILAQAIADIEAEGLAERPALVVGREGWNPGVVGIVAGRLADQYRKPVVVVGFEGGVGRGSARGPEGVRLHDALSEVADCLDRFGGHQAAAGLEVRIERLGELRRRFEQAIASAPAREEDARSDLVRLCPEDDPARVLSDLDRLEPCGHKNPAPRFVLDATVTRARSVKGGHLSLELEIGPGRKIRGFGIGMGDRAERIGPTARLIGKLRRDAWVGGGAVEVMVERFLD